MDTVYVALLGAILPTIGVIITALYVYKGRKDVSGDKTVDEEAQMRAELRQDAKDAKVEAKELKAQNALLSTQNQLLTDQNAQLEKVKADLEKLILELRAQLANAVLEIQGLKAKVNEMQIEITANVLEQRRINRKGDNV